MTTRTLYPPAMIVAAVVLACAAALSAASREAEAAFPGQNGGIVYTLETASDDPWSLYSRDPETGALTRLTNNDRTENQDEDPAVSPDGTRVAFTRSNLSFDAPYFSGIYVVGSDGTGAAGAGARKIADDPALVEYGPAWSPDGERIAFSAYPYQNGERAGSTEVYVVDADGTDPKKITDSALAESDPAWSPDGTEIAFGGYGDQDGDGVSERGVYVMGADGSGTREIAEGAQPSWSPDGEKLAYACGAFPEGAICTVNPDGSDQRKIVTDRFEDDPDVLRAHDFNPAWSPDGTKVAFERNLRTVHLNGWYVYTMNPDGSELEYASRCCRSHDPDWGPAPAEVPAPADTIAPRGLVAIDGGRGRTLDRSVTLAPRAFDPAPGSGVSQMRLRNGGEAWRAWRSYAGHTGWWLSPGEGTKTVFAQYRDGAGNVSTVARDSIVYRR